MKPTFENSTNVLIKAYLEGTLIHANCHACAVGNLIASANGIKFRRQDDYCDTSRFRFLWDMAEYSDANWINVFCTNGKRQRITLENYQGQAKVEIDSTGYSVQELARIEYAFETADFGADDWEYAGLVAVFNVLADIHQVDLTTRQTALEALEAAK